MVIILAYFHTKIIVEKDSELSFPHYFHLKVPKTHYFKLSTKLKCGKLFIQKPHFKKLVDLWGNQDSYVFIAQKQTQNFPLLKKTKIKMWKTFPYNHLLFVWTIFAKLQPVYKKQKNIDKIAILDVLYMFLPLFNN